MSNIPSFISVQEAGRQGSDVSTGTYKQPDDSQQTLKIENGRLKREKEKLISKEKLHW